jgi:hypothetical protein
LRKSEPTASTSVRSTVLDARLVCAERLAATGHIAEASAEYKSLTDAKFPKPVQLAARRGLLTLLQQK